MLPLHEFCEAQGWHITGEFIDRASATDLRGRTGWHDLLDVAARLLRFRDCGLCKLSVPRRARVMA
jgi:hypothetical protein